MRKKKRIRGILCSFRQLLSVAELQRHVVLVKCVNTRLIQQWLRSVHEGNIEYRDSHDIPLRYSS